MCLVQGIWWALDAMGRDDGRCGLCLAISNGCYKTKNEVVGGADKANILAPILGGAEERRVLAHIIGEGGGGCG